MDNFDLKKYLAEGRLLKEAYNLPDSDSTTDQYVNNHWDGILKDILRAHTDLRNSKGGESIPERPSQLDIDIVLGRFDGADEFMDVDPNVYDEYFDFYDMYLVTQRDEENTKSISDEDYPKGNYDGYTKRDDLPKLSEGKLYKDDVWYIEASDDSADIEQAGPKYKEAVINFIKAKHPDISDEDLEASIEVMNVTWYNEARDNAKGSEPEEMEVSAEDFADGAMEHYEDVIVWDNNNIK